MESATKIIRPVELARSVLTSPLFPVVLTAARDQERFAQPGCFVLAAHLFDLGIPLGDASERMPSDFFKLHAALKVLRSQRAIDGSPLRVLLRCALTWTH